MFLFLKCKYQFYSIFCRHLYYPCERIGRVLSRSLSICSYHFCHMCNILYKSWQVLVLLYFWAYLISLSLFNDTGFVNPLGFCCGHHKDSSLKCWHDAVVNGTKVYGASCSNPSEYISWDEIHYTEAANYWISNRILDGSLSDPQVPLTEVCL